jgi:serine/threonine protein kinase HipA of HipAB toxin-antitoxin module
VDGTGSFRRLYAASLLRPEAAPVSGVMPKISAGSALPAILRDQAVILKIASQDHPLMPLVEKACLDACPLPTAKSELHQDQEGWWALSSERFDRTPLGPLHAEDGCQLLDLYPSQKYRTSTEDLIRKAMSLASSPAQTGRDLLALFAYSWLIGGHDLHAKNVSLLERDGLIRLSPIYDVVSDFGLGRDDTRMALPLLGQDQDLGRASFEALGRELELPAKAVQRSLRMAESGAERLIALLPASRLPSRIAGRFVRKVQARLDRWI